MSMIQTPTSRNMNLYKRLTFSSYPDPTHGHPVLALLQAEQHVRDAFDQFIHKVVQRLKPLESVEVYWWRTGLLYVSVKDDSIKHYPCNGRFNITFDTTSGNLNHPDSNCFARRGWYKFAEEISQGRKVLRYSECSNPRKTTGC